MKKTMSSSSPLSKKNGGKLVKKWSIEDDDEDFRPMHTPLRGPQEGVVAAAMDTSAAEPKDRSSKSRPPVPELSVVAPSNQTSLCSTKEVPSRPLVGYVTPVSSVSTGFNSATTTHDDPLRGTASLLHGVEGCNTKGNTSSIGAFPMDSNSLSLSQSGPQGTKQSSPLELADAVHQSPQASAVDDKESENKTMVPPIPPKKVQRSPFCTSSFGEPIVAQLASNDAEEVAEGLSRQIQELNRQLAERLANERQQPIMVDAIAIALEDGQIQGHPKRRDSLDVGNENGNSNKILGCSKRTFFMLLAAFLVIILGAVGAKLASRGGGDDDGDSSKVPLPPGSVVPTIPLPTQSPTLLTTPAFETLLASIGKTISNDLDTLYNPDTVQYQALDWLANKDKYDTSNATEQVLVERYALAVLYLTLNGPMWINHFSFLSDSSVCFWRDADFFDGVSCDADNLHVLQLQLYGINATGEVPTEIGLLSNLNTLDFSYNTLSGSLPLELFQLTNLKMLFLGACFLTGTIPTEIGWLTKIIWLDLDQNSITGTLPTELAALTQLQVLYLLNNNLQGSLPETLGALSTLEDFDVQGSGLTGTIPTEIGNWSQMIFLFLEQNEFRGTLPTELGRMTQLYSLALYDNLLTGTVPVELSSMQQLEYLQLDQNMLEGNFDAIFCDVDQPFPTLYISADCLGEDPEVICSCCTFCCDTNTCSEVSTSNETGSTQPPTIANSPEFFILIDRIGDLVADDPIVFQDQNSIQYQAMDWMANRDEWEYDSLTAIDEQVLVERFALAVLHWSTGGQRWWKHQLSFLTNSSVCSWRNVTIGAGVYCDVDNVYVERLRLDYIDAQGEIPTEIGLLSKLRGLQMSNNRLFGTMPLKLFQLTGLDTISIHDCDLHGTIPTEIGRLTNMDSLELDRNSFTGTLPTQLSALTELRLLQLSENIQLQGSIPESFGALTMMENFSVSGIGLTGTIPTELGNWIGMKTLHLHQNQLRGTLPTEIGRMIDIVEFVVDDNGLTGTLPTELISMVQLNILHLENNNFTGSIDNVFCATDRPLPIETLWADCCEVVCSCCTHCCDTSECSAVTGSTNHT